MVRTSGRLTIRKGSRPEELEEGRTTLVREAERTDDADMTIRKTQSDRIWTVIAVLVFGVMTVTALSDFETSGWLLIPVAGAVLYWIIHSAVTAAVKH